MISTKKPNTLPDRETLRTICKAISVLDAVICPDWEYRCYSYNNQWGKGEECLQMKDSEGGEMHILFREDGCAIAGFSPNHKQPKAETVTYGAPAIFHEFFFGQPIKTIGITFCLWNTQNGWETGKITSHDNGSDDQLVIFDAKPETYIEWANAYFEEGCREEGLSMATVKEIYAGQPLTRKMVLSLVDELEDWDQLKDDLDEIGYPYDFKRK